MTEKLQKLSEILSQFVPRHEPGFVKVEKSGFLWYTMLAYIKNIRYKVDYDKTNTAIGNDDP